MVVGALGSTSKKLKYCTEELGVVLSTGLLQKTIVLETGHILKVLDCTQSLWKTGVGEGEGKEKKLGNREDRGGGGKGSKN